MELHLTLLIIGGLILLGLAADEIGRRTRLPRVTLLLLFGVIAGPSVFDLLPKELATWYELLASIALTMVAFLLGGTLSLETLRRHGKEIVIVSLSVAVMTAFVVSVGLVAIGVATPLALLLGGIATATDPAATQDVIRQIRAKGSFTTKLLGIVAIDDAWGLIIFSIMLVAAKSVMGNGSIDVISHGAWEIFGAVAVGLIVGLPGALLTGRLRPGEPVQSEAIGIVFVCAGLAIWLGVSFLLAGMVAGFVIVNLAQHHSRPFHEIEQIEWPFMVIFFVLAGASLQLSSVAAVGFLGGVCIVLRITSRVLGGWLGGWLTGAPAQHRRWMGVALLPQAGVALGMALMASGNIGSLKEPLLAVAIGTTVAFEIIGPALTQLALKQVGESD